jgi:hypothetical protein
VLVLRVPARLASATTRLTLDVELTTTLPAKGLALSVLLQPPARPRLGLHDRGLLFCACLSDRS